VSYEDIIMTILYPCPSAIRKHSELISFQLRGCCCRWAWPNDAHRDKLKCWNLIKYYIRNNTYISGMYVWTPGHGTIMSRFIQAVSHHVIPLYSRPCLLPLKYPQVCFLSSFSNEQNLFSIQSISIPVPEVLFITGRDLLAI